MAEDAAFTLNQCAERHVWSVMWYMSDMANLDLNLMNPLHARRTEENVASAVRRLHMGLYGMSRALAICERMWKLMQQVEEAWFEKYPCAKRHTWPLGVAY